MCAVLLPPGVNLISDNKYIYLNSRHLLPNDSINLGNSVIRRMHLLDVMHVCKQKEIFLAPSLNIMIKTWWVPRGQTTRYHIPEHQNFYLA